MARSGDFGWAGSRSWARGRVGRPKKVNLGRKLLETEDGGKSLSEVASLRFSDLHEFGPEHKF